MKFGIYFYHVGNEGVGVSPYGLSKPVQFFGKHSLYSLHKFGTRMTRIGRIEDDLLSRFLNGEISFC